jgi:hypothetical protein
MSEMTTVEMQETQGGTTGTATGKLYVATNVGVFVEVPDDGDVSQTGLLIGTDGGIW